MNVKETFYCETAYMIGIILLAFGTALMEKADLGMSMIVAPAYIIHLKVSEYFPFFTFGVSEYVFQALLLFILSIVMGKIKKCYFLSFLTVLIYGRFLDIFMTVSNKILLKGLIGQILFFAIGLLICATAVALLFHTYLPPESYELFVKEFSIKYNITIGKMKTLYDCCSCILSIALSLIFFGTFVGVKWGTIICALVNGWLISSVGKVLEEKFYFKDAFPLRKKIM